MSDTSLTHSRSVGLRVGDLVEVRSEAEILATLDEHARLGALPFMPEMLRYAGQRFRVFKRVDKACDTIVKDGIRRMENTVILDGLRCDGVAHSGCQAACMILWKEAWLKLVQKKGSSLTAPVTQIHQIQTSATMSSAHSGTNGAASPRCAREKVYDSVYANGAPALSGDEVYSCQATEMRKSTSPMKWWAPGQYWRDIRSGNVGVWPLLRSFGIWVFNLIQHYRKGGKYPFIEGKLTKTPHMELHLQPGELVQLLPKVEILKTLDKRNRNRGLSFDKELVKYCGGVYRVFRRVDKLIDEANGKVLHLSNPCIVLEGVTCTGDYNRYCPRNIFHYVREIWLKRVEDSTKLDLTPRPCDTNSLVPADCSGSPQTTGVR
jgi:hypothetical protein